MVLPTAIEVCYNHWGEYGTRLDMATKGRLRGKRVHPKVCCAITSLWHLLAILGDSFPSLNAPCPGMPAGQDKPLVYAGDSGEMPGPYSLPGELSSQPGMPTGRPGIQHRPTGRLGIQDRLALVRLGQM